jgi:FMN phosphatase YigB (HAD superfamily)
MKILALDIGNVCVKIDFANFARNLNIPEIPAPIVALQRDLECGRTTDEAFIYAVCQCCKTDPITAMKAFNSILIEAVPGMEELISSLDKYGYEARFFSDISLTHLARTHELFSGADYVPDGMYSFVSGAQKPAEEMFAAFEEKFGTPALYVDDRAELIEAARKRGWNAIQFTTAEALAAALN